MRPSPPRPTHVRLPRPTRRIPPDAYDLDLRPEFLVKGILVKGAPCIVGGRSKTLKTTVAVDLAISLGSGTKFLGRYEVPRAVKVAFWTGESGQPTIRETALRIAKSKGLDLGGVAVDWSFDLPKLCREDHITALKQVILERHLEVIIIDPLYLSLLSAETAGQASNLFAMGAALEPLSRLAQETGVTIILLHHFRKSATHDPTNPCELEDLSQSGGAEWARQWLLLQRKGNYQPDGTHDLWLRAGGSAGHSTLVALAIDEGLIDPETGGGRHWKVVVSNQAEAIADDRAKKVAERLEKQDAKEVERIAKVVEALKRNPKGKSVRGLRTETGLDTPTLNRILDRLTQDGTAVGCEVVWATGRGDGYTLAK